MTFDEQIRILIGQAVRERIYYWNTGNQWLDPKAFINAAGAETQVYAAGEVVMKSEPAILLQQIYAAATPDDRRLFAPALVRTVNFHNARVIARTMAATGNLASLKGVVDLEAVGEELLRGLVHVMRFESQLFTETDLVTIEEITTTYSAEAYKEALSKARTLGGMVSRVVVASPGSVPVYQPYVPQRDLVTELHSVVSRIRYLRLAKAIREHQNLAVDADRQVLLSRLQAMGFSDKLSNASNEIERRAAVSSSETDVKSVMDLTRTFFEEFIEEACRKVEPKIGNPVPSGATISHFAPFRQYLENANLIGAEESQLLQKLYNFLSNQGTHKLGSAPEQLRVAHATVIEWCMLIAGRIVALLG